LFFTILVDGCLQIRIGAAGPVVSGFAVLLTGDAALVFFFTIRVNQQFSGASFLAGLVAQIRAKFQMYFGFDLWAVKVFDRFYNDAGFHGIFRR
jgi:hypothetical protein